MPSCGTGRGRRGSRSLEPRPGPLASGPDAALARAARVRLLHGSLVYRDERLSGFDGAAVVEVVEHLEPPRLTAFERVLFEFARPRTIALTTPNAEYHVRMPNWQL